MNEDIIFKMLDNNLPQDVKIAHAILIQNEDTAIEFYKKFGEPYTAKEVEGLEFSDCYLIDTKNFGYEKYVTLGNKIMLYSFSRHLLGILKQ